MNKKKFRTRNGEEVVVHDTLYFVAPKKIPTSARGPLSPKV